MRIKVPIPVKLVITEKTKENLINDIEISIEKLKTEMNQLQFQHKKLLNDAKKKGKDNVRVINERINYENQRRQEKLDILIAQLDKIENIRDGEEIHHDTVESEIDINVGDSWSKIYNTNEIIIKDGIIIDIREVEKKWKPNI